MAEHKLGAAGPRSPRAETERTEVLAEQPRAVQERHRRNVVAPSYVHATHPEHGEPVVFVPGEALPEWVADALDGGRFTRLRDGVITLDGPDREPGG